MITCDQLPKPFIAVTTMKGLLCFSQNQTGYQVNSMDRRKRARSGEIRRRPVQLQLKCLLKGGLFKNDFYQRIIFLNVIFSFLNGEIDTL